MILLYTALLSFLLGMAGRMKMEFHYREAISMTGFTIAGILVALAIVMFLFSSSKKQE